VIRKLVSLAISLLILCAIYYKIDIHRLGQVFAGTDLLWLVISLAMVIPLTICTAWRLEMIAPAGANIHFGEAMRLNLVASTFNMILPSKMGDIVKAFFMRSETMRGSLTLSLVIFEKSADMLSLLFWCALGLFFYPNKDAIFWILTVVVVAGLAGGILLLASKRLANFAFGLTKNEKIGKLQDGWQEMQKFFWSDKQRVASIAVLSVFIWLLHLLQIWFFILALRAHAPFLASVALAPLALLAGLLPLTFAGIGTRDAALILLYKPYLDAPIAAALGVLCTARYLLPAIAGLPFLHRYIGALNAKHRQ
jgi:uncharacterized protein (TIRG00374 family)